MKWLLCIALFAVLATLPNLSTRAHPACGLPFVAFSTLLGDELEENGNGIAVSADGRIHLAITTYSNNFPAVRRRPSAPLHGVDAAVVSFSADGGWLDSVLWINPPSSSAEDEGLAIDVDAAGNQYVVGRTASADFCANLGNLPGYDTTHNGGSDGFLIKLDPIGTPLACSYIGGSDFDVARAVAASPAGEVYVTGGSWSTDFPTTAGASHAGLRDAFVLKFAADGTLAYSMLVGGDNQEEGLGIALNAAGAAFVIGWSSSVNLPATNDAFDTSANGSFDAFVLQLEANGEGVEQLSYLGGSDEDRAYALALDAQGRVYVVGTTLSADFPTSSSAYQTLYGGAGLGGHDAFVSVFAADGANLTYSTYIGKLDEERALDVAVVDGQLFVTGFTRSADFPTTSDGAQRSFGGVQDAFLLKFAAFELVYSSFWGGSDAEVGNGLAVQGSDVYLVGETRSADFCTTPNVFDTTHNGDYDVFLTQLSLPNKKVFLPVILRQSR